MTLNTPRLDDRAFDDLVNEARARIPLYTPEWRDHYLSDAAITHIDLFAWNDGARAGRPVGGEAQTLRTLLAYLEQRFAAGATP